MLYLPEALAVSRTLVRSTGLSNSRAGAARRPLDLSKLNRNEAVHVRASRAETGTSMVDVEF
jgi:hypothetical protein